MKSFAYPQLDVPIKSWGAEPIFAGRKNKWPRILIVDDERDICLVMTAFLRGVVPGQRLRAECDPVKARELLREFRPDILITDLAMPILDGLRLSRIAGSDPILPGLKIVAVTAQSGLNIRSRAFESGVQEIVSKPFSREELRAAVRRALAID